MEKIRALWQRWREQISYLFFGACTTAVSLGSYWLLTRFTPLGASAAAANVCSNIIAILFAYVTNRTWVFAEKAHTPAGILREMLSFFGGRAVTMLGETALVWLLADRMHLPDMPVKLVTTILVIVANYFISKLLVFRGERKKP